VRQQLKNDKKGHSAIGGEKSGWPLKKEGTPMCLAAEANNIAETCRIPYYVIARHAAVSRRQVGRT
jgi:hypothetical protein